MSDVLRFIKKIQFGDNGCWEWTACRQSEEGYGRFGWNGKTGYAHRFSYENAVGDIPQGLDIDHTCNNKVCVNPKHLRAVDRQVNNLAAHSNTLARINAEKNTCNRGHPYDSWNLVAAINNAGRRSCRACGIARSKARRENWSELELSIFADQKYEELKAGLVPA